MRWSDSFILTLLFKPLFDSNLGHADLHRRLNEDFLLYMNKVISMRMRQY